MTSQTPVRLIVLEGLSTLPTESIELRDMLKIIAATEHKTLRHLVLETLAEKYPELEEAISQQINTRYKRR